MANIRVDLDYTLHDGADVAFNAPCDCTEVTGLIIYYPQMDGTTTSKTFTFRDAHKNDLGSLTELFVADARVKVHLDVVNGWAFVQNADTNAYLEAQLAGKAPANSILLTEAADLNNIVDEGEYYYGWYQESIANTPVHSAFHLSVKKVAAVEVSQTYTQFTGGYNVIYTRQSASNKTAWSAWDICYTASVKPTPADLGAAPAGYGLGIGSIYSLKAINSEDEAKAIGETGWYGYHGPALATGCNMGIIRAEITSGIYKVLHFVDLNGNRLVNTLVYDVWTGWQWKNPPMLDGVEYLTTERYNGQPVYAKRISFGSLADAGGTKKATIGTGISQFVSVAGVATEMGGTFAYSLPLIDGTDIFANLIVTKTDDTMYLECRSAKTLTAYTGCALVKYTKG